MNYDDMSDFEINKKLAGLLFPKCTIVASPYERFNKIISNTSSTVVDIRFSDGMCIEHTYKDYCNNWADIGPLIEEHLINDGFNINVTSRDGYERVFIYKGQELEFANNGQFKRAISICIIMKLEGEKS